MPMEFLLGALPIELQCLVLTLVGPDHHLVALTTRTSKSFPCDEVFDLLLCGQGSWRAPGVSPSGTAASVAAAEAQVSPPPRRSARQQRGGRHAWLKAASIHEQQFVRVHVEIEGMLDARTMTLAALKRAMQRPSVPYPVDHPSFDGSTILLVVLLRCHSRPVAMACVRHLTGACLAEVNCSDLHDLTPLHIAAGKPGDIMVDCVRLLLGKGASTADQGACPGGIQMAGGKCVKHKGRHNAAGWARLYGNSKVEAAILAWEKNHLLAGPGCNY